jgi:ATP-dependent Lon protease
VHIHVPEGAIPKDGPSAGITIATALISAFTGRRVHKEVGMTGEITLRGRVLPVGGVREKVLAAHRIGLKTVILPARNEKDLVEVPQKVRAELTLKLVTHMDEVLAVAIHPAEDGNSRNGASSRTAREAAPSRRAPRRPTQART